ncbi:hypothetical protein [Maritimibacter sp. HL-12]|uniref:hypothetical protein n=1 Tax=Maritimibacter sp. HL-12 TaxID=1162418 RepID=UPI0020CAF7EE|nr:hypothetical protein [Maritimibacter sp. HL-12]
MAVIVIGADRLDNAGQLAYPRVANAVPFCGPEVLFVGRNGDLGPAGSFAKFGKAQRLPDTGNTMRNEHRRVDEGFRLVGVGGRDNRASERGMILGKLFNECAPALFYRGLERRERIARGIMK